MPGKITIGCRLPNGLTLSHPNPQVKLKFTLTGLHKAKIIGSTFVTTEIDADFWETWKNAYSTYAPLVSGAIFEARNEQEAASKAKDLVKEKTGFEALSQEQNGIKKANA